MASCVVFNPPLRTSSKRKRMPGTNKYAKEECKKAAMFTSTTSLEAIYKLFEFNSILGAFASDAYRVIRGSWMPIEVLHPSQGTAGYNRIGQSYFLKYFRLKGYCSVKASTIRPIHWRLRLIRVEDEGVFTLPTESSSSAIASNYKNVVNQYLSTMFRNPLLLESNDSIELKSSKLASNYYCALKTRLEDKTIDSKIIASGTVAPSNVLTSFAEVAPGSTTAATGFSYNALGDLPADWAYTKLDCRVVLNDNISYKLWKKNDGVNYLVSDVDYYVVLETDCCMGFDIYDANTSVEGNDQAGGFKMTQNILDAGFTLGVTQIQYFTDP